MSDQVSKAYERIAAGVAALSNQQLAADLRRSAYGLPRQELLWREALARLLEVLPDRESPDRSTARSTAAKPSRLLVKRPEGREAAGLSWWQAR